MCVVTRLPNTAGDVCHGRDRYTTCMCVWWVGFGGSIIVPAFDIEERHLSFVQHCCVCVCEWMCVFCGIGFVDWLQCILRAVVGCGRSPQLNNRECDGLYSCELLLTLSLR